MDDLETATSSDIEIISHISSSTNGDRLPFQLTTLRPGATRGATSAMHRRTDSDSSLMSLPSRADDDFATSAAAAPRRVTSSRTRSRSERGRAHEGAAGTTALNTAQ